MEKKKKKNNLVSNHEYTHKYTIQLVVTVLLKKNVH